MNERRADVSDASEKFARTRMLRMRQTRSPFKEQGDPTSCGQRKRAQAQAHRPRRELSRKGKQNNSELRKGMISRIFVV